MKKKDKFLGIIVLLLVILLIISFSFKESFDVKDVTFSMQDASLNYLKFDSGGIAQSNKWSFLKTKDLSIVPGLINDPTQNTGVFF